MNIRPPIIELAAPLGIGSLCSRFRFPKQRENKVKRHFDDLILLY
jgi:hypothetical protein